MNNFIQSLIDGLDKTTEAGFAEALLIAIGNLKNEQGLLLNIKLSDDFNQQIDFAKQIARMMVKEKP
jgi:spore coat protein CotF